MSSLIRFSEITFKIPFEAVMEKVASVHTDGTLFRTYQNYHDGLYASRVTADADFQAMALFLRLTNFTSRMENAYCVSYEMSGPNDL